MSFFLVNYKELIWPLRVDIYILWCVREKERKKLTVATTFQDGNIFLSLRKDFYHSANYIWLNLPFSTFFCDGDKELSLEDTSTFQVLLSEWIKSYSAYLFVQIMQSAESTILSAQILLEFRGIRKQLLFPIQPFPVLQTQKSKLKQTNVISNRLRS